MKSLIIFGLLATQILDPAQLKNQFFPSSLVSNTELYGKSQTQSRCLMQYIENDNEIGALIWDATGDRLQFLTVPANQQVTVSDISSSQVLGARKIKGSLLIMDGPRDSAPAKGTLEILPFSPTKFEMRFIDEEGILAQSCAN